MFLKGKTLTEQLQEEREKLGNREGHRNNRTATKNRAGNTTKR